MHMYPHITQYMFNGTDSTVTYVFRQILRMTENLRL